MALGTAKMCTLSFKSTKSCISMGNLSTSRLPIRRTEALWILLVGMCKIVYMPPFPSRTMKVHHHWAQEPGYMQLLPYIFTFVNALRSWGFQSSRVSLANNISLSPHTLIACLPWHCSCMVCNGPLDKFTLCTQSILWQLHRVFHASISYPRLDNNMFCWLPLCVSCNSYPR